MVLVDLIGYLLEKEPNAVLAARFKNPHSYRGYYDNLALEMTWEEPQTVRELHDLLDSCLGRTFTGWKGGDYEMGPYVDVWVSELGESSGDTLSKPLLEALLKLGELKEVAA